ncbi:MAG: hypothetical protein V1846_01275, partial [Candidatus Komeilibacteria bacterium]
VKELSRPQNVPSASGQTAKPFPAPAPVPPKPVMPAPAPTIPSKPVMPPTVPFKPAPAPMPAMPSKPSVPPVATPNPSGPNQFYVPEASVKTSSGRSLVFIGIGSAVIVLGVLYWFFFIHTPNQIVKEPTETFTPVPTATPRIPISSLFSGSAGTIALLPTDSLQTFVNGVKTVNVLAGQLRILAVTASDSSDVLLPFDLFDRLLLTYPSELKPNIDNDDGVVLVYGQQEVFNNKGQLIQGATSSTRLVLISQVSDSAAAVLRTWEATMTDNLATLFNVNKTKNTGEFSDALYQGQPIRFKNFPNPDMSIDYTLVTYNGASYMIMANSRESMFATINAFYSQGK